MVVLQEVFDFLKSSQYYKTLFSLEQESGHSSLSLESDLSHIYTLVSQGEYARLCSILSDIKESYYEAYKEATFHVKTQELLEKIQLNSSDFEAISVNIAELAAVSERSHVLHIYEAVKKGDLNEFANWEMWRGRWNCWQNLVEILSERQDLQEEEDVELSESVEEYSENYEKDDYVIYESDS